jgi:2-phosphosulfolactate phosphatase
MKMEIDVALVPALARGGPDTVCVVIDELRASSTITTLLDRKCDRVLVAVELQAARRLARSCRALLVGERQGVKPKGFDFDNSPVTISRGRVSGRAVVLSTTNGTKILSRVADASAVLVGCLLNARACARAAVAMAQARDARIRIACAGRSRRFAIEDAVAAGVLVERMVEAAAKKAGACTLSEAARACVRLRQSYPDLLTPLRESNAGRHLTEIGAGEDVSFCARLDVSTTVPVLRRRGRSANLVIERWHRR